MLLQRLVTGVQAEALGNLADARCERCAWPHTDGSIDLVQSVIVLEQVRNPGITYRRFIGACAVHYPPALAKAYAEHGWVVRWKASRPTPRRT
jgi:hypothetical protein